MEDPYTSDAAQFLIGTLFGIYILLVMLRCLFQIVRADFYNPLSQFIVKITNPPLRPLRKFIPGFYGIDTASVALMFILKFIELYLLISLSSASGSVVGISVLAIAELLALVITIYLFAIIVLVIISWINPGVHNPVLALLRSLTEPLLQPARRLVGTGAGLDFSPLIVMVGLVLCQKLVIARLLDMGRQLL